MGSSNCCFLGTHEGIHGYNRYAVPLPFLWSLLYLPSGGCGSHQPCALQLIGKAITV
ncbi:uncharacterized protein G2W53_005592 [Senna tora]|uniref:Uncharacterized protein n=1 Tax=Senna tora TaxID=362788 RepID=A0A834X2E8_9FABA|nr:uncharacterized protein G2W53_005592 [Senna tora]